MMEAVDPPTTDPPPSVAPDFGRPDFYLGDAEAVYARLRREDPVHRWEPRTGFPIWILTRWADVRAVSRQPGLFRSGGGIRLIDMLRRAAGETSALGEAFETIVHMDPPRHGRVRALLNKVFTPRRISALEPWMRETFRAQLAALAPDEPIDLVAEIAAPIPAIAIARVLGVPEAEWREFQASADALIALDGGEVEGAAAAEAMAQAGAFFARVRAWVDARSAASGDDLLSALVQVEQDGLRFDANDVVTLAVTLLVAGNETTRTLISGACLALDRHPGEREKLVAEPRLMPGAVEEFLRWVTPVHGHARTATAKTELAGVEIGEGEAVVMMYRSANRDETVWRDPGRFDVARPIAENPHLAFGYGEHFCLGASLARLEARVVCEELLARYPRFSVVGEPEMQRSTHFAGIVRMPVVLDAG